MEQHQPETSLAASRTCGVRTIWRWLLHGRITPVDLVTALPPEACRQRLRQVVAPLPITLRERSGYGIIGDLVGEFHTDGFTLRDVRWRGGKASHITSATVAQGCWEQLAQERTVIHLTFRGAHNPVYRMVLWDLVVLISLATQVGQADAARLLTFGIGFCVLSFPVTFALRALAVSSGRRRILNRLQKTLYARVLC